MQETLVVQGHDLRALHGLLSARHDEMHEIRLFNSASELQEPH